MDYYKILEVNKKSSLEEIKKSYKKLAVKNHPDKGGDPKIFKKISEAYQVLSNPEKRRIYDNENIYDNLRGQNEFTDANELFNFVFSTHNPHKLNNLFSSRINISTNSLFTHMANLNIGGNNVNSFSKSTSITTKDGKKIETTTEM